MDRASKRARGRGAGMSKFWQRAFVFAAAFLLLLFASNDFGLIDIQKTAIVLALGVDASAQEGLLDVTAQIGSADANGGKRRRAGEQHHHRGGEHGGRGDRPPQPPHGLVPHLRALPPAAARRADGGA